MAQMSQAGDLTSGPMLKKIILFSLPLAASSFLQLLFNAADVVVVGRFVGSAALAAVGSNGALINLLVNLFVGLALGANVVAARCYGAKDDQGVHEAVQTAVTLSLVGGVLMAFVGFFAAHGLLELMSSPEDVIDLATLYLKIYFIGMPMTMLYNFNASLLRAVGDTRRPLVCLAVAGVINVVLNLLFVIVFQMSVAGVALATILSQLASFCMLLLGCARGGNLRIRLKNVCFRRDLFLEIGKGGLPSLCRQGLASIATICLNRSAGLYGDAAIAAMSVVSRAMMLAQSALIGFGQGFQPVCGFNYGAGLYHRVKEGFRFCVKWSTVFLTAVSVLGLVLAPQIIAVFRNDPEVIAFGARALRLQCLAFPLCGVIVISSMLTQTINKVWQASVLAVARQGLFFIPAVLALPHIWGELGVQLAQPVSDVCAFALTVPLVLGVLRDMDRQQRLEKIR